VTDQQEPKTDQQEPKTDQQESKTNQQESKTDQQEPKIDQQESKTDQQESKTDQQESKTDQQDITKIDQPKIDQQEPKTDQQESKFERVWRFLWEMVSFDESELQIAGHIRAITKWLFDLLRNVLMVGFLFYLAKRTNSSILFIAATAANALLMVYLLSYLNTWSIHPYQTYYRLQKPSVVDFLIVMIFVGLIVFSIYFGIPYVANQIASAYENPKSDLVSPNTNSFLE
jgi:DNA mismatch repair ATPase MutL